MVATQTVVHRSASEGAHEDALEEALVMSGQMELLASAGEWGQVEEIAIRLRDVVKNVPEDKRRRIIVEVQRRTGIVADQARQARQEVTSKIHELRIGQAAKKAYELS